LPMADKAGEPRIPLALQRSQLQAEEKTLDFEFEVVSAQFNRQGRYALRLTVENPLLQGSNAGIRLRINNGEVTQSSAGTTDTIEQSDLNQIYSFQQKKFTFTLPRGFCKNDKNHDVRLHIEALYFPGRAERMRRSRQVGEAFFAIYPRTNQPRMKLSARRDEDWYRYSAMMALLRVGSEQPAMHCGRLAFTASLHEHRPPTMPASPPPPSPSTREEDQQAAGTAPASPALDIPVPSRLLRTSETGHGTAQVDNMPWMKSQSPGWLRLSLGAVREGHQPPGTPPGRDGGEGAGFIRTPGDFHSIIGLEGTSGDHLHHGSPLQSPLQQFPVPLEPGSPELDTALQVQPPQGRAEREDDLPPPAGHNLLDAPQDATGLLGHEGTLLAHGHPVVHQDSRSLSKELLSSRSPPSCPGTWGYSSPGDFAAEHRAWLRGISPQVSRRQSLPLGTIPISLPAGLRGAGGAGASFWRSPWQWDLVASPQEMVCFQFPWTSWQRGARPKTAICCCRGTRNRSPFGSKQMGWRTACVPAWSRLFTRLRERRGIRQLGETQPALPVLSAPPSTACKAGHGLRSFNRAEKNGSKPSPRSASAVLYPFGFPAERNSFPSTARRGCKEVGSYRLVLKRMAGDLLSLRQRVTSLEVENGHLRHSLALQEELGHTLLADHVALAVADTLKRKLAASTAEMRRLKDRVQQLQNELIRKNDREKDLVLLQRAYQQQQATLRRCQEKVAKTKGLEETVRQQEKVIEAMERVLQEKLSGTGRSPEKPAGHIPVATPPHPTGKAHSGKVYAALLEENHRLRDELARPHHPLPPITPQPPALPGVFGDAEKLSLLAKLEEAQARGRVLERQLEEAARRWGREKQDLGTRLLEREHGF
ncbi:CCD33 protein, partial [Larus smithsonianus]|nr:CCD33 protein [Larus smithsonianus]